MRDLIAVSYTHLDVYKRQHSTLVVFCCSSRVEASNSGSTPLRG